MARNIFDPEEALSHQQVKTRKTRKTKTENGNYPEIKEQYVHQATNKLMEKFTPTPPQKQLINKVRENTLVFVDAVAGVGKSSAILWYYCQEYLRDPSKQIVITRTPVEAGTDKIGFLPDGYESKVAVHAASSRKILEEFLGKSRVAADWGKRIHFMIPNYILGTTVENSLWLIDECQQLQPLIMKLLLERIGKNTKCVVAGCSDQLYVKDTNRNGLSDAVNRFFTKDFTPKYDDVAYHTFEVEDVMRHDIVKSVIKAYKGIGG